MPTASSRPPEQIATPASRFTRATRLAWKWLLPVMVGALVAFAGIAVGAASQLVMGDPDGSLRWALAGFANSTVWLVVAALMFALGYEKTGLGRRIALLLVRRLGGRTLGLGYAVMLGEVALAPFTPSNVARSGGTIFPVIRNIPPLYDSHPGESARRIGAYVMWVALAANAVTSSMFLTALANNLLALEIVEKTTGQAITMGGWLAGFLPMGLLLIATLPGLVYRLYPLWSQGATKCRPGPGASWRAWGLLPARNG